MFCIASRLYYLQVIENKRYQTLSDNNRIQVSLMGSSRGKICDKNGIELAYNKKQYNLSFQPITGVDIKQVTKKLLQILELPHAHHQSIFDLLNGAAEHVIIQEDISWSTIQRIEFNMNDLRGVLVDVDHKRSYIGSACSHLIGYTRRTFNRYGVYSYVGSSGVEYLYNDKLQGSPGVVQNEVNAKGQVVRSLSKITSKVGNDIKLSIDYRLQSFISSVLDQVGSVVVMDVNNGEILAMHNHPSYDNNLFVKTITTKAWEELNHNQKYPLLNRAVAVQTPPGSTFKLVSALAALEGQFINPNTVFTCNGQIKVGDRYFRCWKKEGHGSIGLTEAIASSCNVYFYQTALRLNIDYLLDIAKKLGLGELSGLGLKEELVGIIPDQKWRHQKNIRWYQGDTINSTIGHGYILTTPIQLAIMTARLATGKMVKPSLMTRSEQFQSLNINNEHLELIQRGMHNAVENGTAFRVHSDLESRAGKTGTAQLTSTANNHQSQNHSLFVGYAPYHKPKYAISVVLEHTNFGGSASQLAKKIFDYMHENNM